MAVLRDTDDAESRETGKWWHYHGIDKPPTLGVRPLIDDSDSQYFWNRQKEITEIRSECTGDDSRSLVVTGRAGLSERPGARVCWGWNRYGGRCREFRVQLDDGSNHELSRVPLAGSEMFKDADDPEIAPYIVGVRWIKTVPVEEAIYEKGFFGNQNTVCKPTTKRWHHTVDRLKQHFKVE